MRLFGDPSLNDPVADPLPAPAAAPSTPPAQELVAKRPADPLPAPIAAPPARPAEPAKLADRPGDVQEADGHCRRCGATRFVDVAMHEGQSSRRTCAGCGRMVGFTRWYGQPMTPDEWMPGPPPVAPPPLWWLDPVEWINPTTGEPETSLPVVSEDQPPKDVAAPCHCGCPNFWEDLAGNLHCAACIRIPARQMANGRAWSVLWSRDGCWWAEWNPINDGSFLFDHLQREEQARIAAMPKDDF